MRPSFGEKILLNYKKESETVCSLLPFVCAIDFSLAYLGDPLVQCCLPETSFYKVHFIAN
jgi:hypothetical protein